MLVHVNTPKNAPKVPDISVLLCCPTVLSEGQSICMFSKGGLWLQVTEEAGGDVQAKRTLQVQPPTLNSW